MYPERFFARRKILITVCRKTVENIFKFWPSPNNPSINLGVPKSEINLSGGKTQPLLPENAKFRIVERISFKKRSPFFVFFSNCLALLTAILAGKSGCSPLNIFVFCIFLLVIIVIMFVKIDSSSSKSSAKGRQAFVDESFCCWNCQFWHKKTQ